MILCSITFTFPQRANIARNLVTQLSQNPVHPGTSPIFSVHHGGRTSSTFSFSYYHFVVSFGEASNLNVAPHLATFSTMNVLCHRILGPQDAVIENNTEYSGTIELSIEPSTASPQAYDAFRRPRSTSGSTGRENLHSKILLRKSMACTHADPAREHVIESSVSASVSPTRGAWVLNP